MSTMANCRDTDLARICHILAGNAEKGDAGYSASLVCGSGILFVAVQTLFVRTRI